MSIWICKTRILVMSGGLALAGCDGATVPFLTSAEDVTPLTQVSLAGGQIQLAAPDGYCIDQRSLRAQFALLGRCDTLGVKGFFNDKDLAIIIASTLPVDAGTASPSADALSADGDVISALNRNGLPLVQLREDDTQIDGVSETHWRTAIVLNDQLVSFVLYAPPGSAALGPEGARLLEQATLATREATSLLAG